MTALYTEVLTRLGDLTLAGEPERLQSNFQSGFKHLPVRWTTG